MRPIGADFNNIKRHERHDDIEAKRQSELGQGDEIHALDSVLCRQGSIQERISLRFSPPDIASGCPKKASGTELRVCVRPMYGRNQVIKGRICRIPEINRFAREQGFLPRKEHRSGRGRRERF